MTIEATITPRAISQRLTVLLKRTISPKQVRGRVRGDAGTPLLERFGEGKAPYQSHLYSVAEANIIGAAFVASDNKRTNKGLKWPAWGSQTRKPRAATGTQGTVKRASLGNKRPTVAGKPIVAEKAVSAAESAV